ncbi:MAG TPA: TonB-dependent receptor, partial [Candidatus Ozemobacteraceae bacterium]|nr:TonB-dependent receptor [Candidatus Ozemobacteraceae bacterium]
MPTEYTVSMTIGHEYFAPARTSKAAQKNLILALTVCLVLFFQTASPAASDTIQLAKLSWEELFDLEVIPVVTSVSRKPEKASMSPAAVFVLTSEAIRRSGATSIPELLQLVPGLTVSRVNGSSWAISARGFNSRFASTLLVLIDGRSVYSPLVSGVYWDVQDLLLDDVERIEVVRGPGGTTWGANAVNGVINIVTKSAQATGNSLLSLDFGTHGETGIAYRHGEVRNDKLAFRYYLKTYDKKAFQTPRVGLSVDDAAQSRFGFRADWENAKKQRMTLDGTVYSGDSHECLILRMNDGFHNSTPGTYKTDVSGGHLRFELSQTPREGEELRLQLYADRARRADARHEEAFDTFDFDLQHSLKPARNHDVVWGIGYRHLSYDLKGSSYVTFDPESDLVTTKSFFAQDQISLCPRKLFLTVGTKIYNHPYVGTESQPSARLLWTPVERHVFWTAFTEAHRIPSISERTEVFIGQYREKTTGSLITVRNVGNTALGSELMKAREVGYRFLPGSKFSFDLAYFR